MWQGRERQEGVVRAGRGGKSGVKGENERGSEGGQPEAGIVILERKKENMVARRRRTSRGQKAEGMA